MSLLLLFSNSNVATSLVGAEGVCFSGSVRPDWHIDSATGQPVAQSDVALVGLQSASASGTVGTANGGSALLGGLSANALAGDLDNESLSALLGVLSTSGMGDVSPDGDGEAPLVDDLIEFQRQRRFGQPYRTLVRTTHRRTVR